MLRAMGGVWSVAAFRSWPTYGVAIFLAVLAVAHFWVGDNLLGLRRDIRANRKTPHPVETR